MKTKNLVSVVLGLSLLSTGCNTTRTPKEVIAYTGRVLFQPGESSPYYAIISKEGDELYRVDWQHPSLNHTEKNLLYKASAERDFNNTIKVDENGRVIHVSLRE